MVKLQVTNYAASLGRSQAGNPAIANLNGATGMIRQRSLDF